MSSNSALLWFFTAVLYTMSFTLLVFPTKVPAAGREPQLVWAGGTAGGGVA